ncbi:MAG: VTT domain-containing protein [Candidatus Micrarchaeota archaeon]|nr:VTT domain-containing protein [Candidatus Micrarchaeota archaeon]
MAKTNFRKKLSAIVMSNANYNTKKPLFSRQDAFALVGAICISLLAIILFTRVGELRHMGYIGVFFISLISSATVFVPLPGFAIVFAMGAFLNPVLVGIAAGIGSGLGEITGYLAGFAGHDAVMGTKLFRQHKRGIEKYGSLAIFALAFIPNPAFDVAGIAAGATRMPLWKFALATIAGKTLRFVLLAYLGGYAYGFWQWG